MTTGKPKPILRKSKIKLSKLKKFQRKNTKLNHILGPRCSEGDTLSTVYNAIQWISDGKTNHAIHRIIIYPVNRVIHPLNNWGQLTDEY